MALTPDEALLLVCDVGYNHVAVLQASDGAWVRAMTGPPNTLSFPFHVVVVPSTGEVLVSDIHRHQVVRFRSIVDETVVGTLGTTGGGHGPSELKRPGSMVIVEDLSVHPLMF